MLSGTLNRIKASRAAIDLAALWDTKLRPRFVHLSLSHLRKASTLEMDFLIFGKFRGGSRASNLYDFNDSSFLLSSTSICENLSTVDLFIELLRNINGKYGLGFRPRTPLLLRD